MKPITQIHFITPGDTFYGIALRYNTSVRELIDLNPDIDYSRLALGSEVIVPAPPMGERIIAAAEAFQGAPYVFGAEGPDEFDCSGFMQYLFRQVAGVDLPRTAASQWDTGKEVLKAKRKPGDLIFWENTRSTDLNHNSITHVGIYVDDDTFIGAQGSTGVAYADLTRDYWQNRYAGAKRMVDTHGRALPRLGDPGDQVRVHAEVLNIRGEASWNKDAIIDQIRGGGVFTIRRRVDMGEETDLFELISGTFITTSEYYVELVE